MSTSSSMAMHPVAPRPAAGSAGPAAVSGVSAIISIIAIIIVILGASPAARAVEILFTDHDQYLLELINRTRADPDAEAARFGIDLNEGLDPGTIPSGPRQPLALELALVDVARTHNADILENIGDLPPDHRNSAGRDPTQRAQDAGIAMIGGVAENNAWTSDSALGKAVDKMHALLFKDFTANFEVVGRGHRKILLNDSRGVVGLAATSGKWLVGPRAGQSASVCTQDFITRNELYLTGVVYIDDRQADAFYTPGEGIGGVLIRAARQGGAGEVYETMTLSTGGYSMNLPAGTYDVSASGDGLSNTIVVEDVVIADRNVKVDFRGDVRPPPPPPPPAFELGKTSGKLNAKTGQWGLKIAQAVYRPGFSGYEGDLSELRVRVDGAEHFGPAAMAGAKIKLTRGKTSGLIEKISIKTAGKDALAIDLVKGSLKATLAALDAAPAETMRIEVILGNAGAAVLTEVDIVEPKLNKAVLSPAIGDVTPIDEEEAPI